MAAERRPGSPAFEDAQLIDRINAGHPEAYADLVRKYQDRVFNTCWRICGHLEDASDITQEAFLKAFEGLDRFRGQSGFYTWVFRIAVNLALSHRRAAARSRTVSWDQRTDASHTQAAELARRGATDPVDDPARAQSRAELHGHVAAALGTLDHDHRAVIVLRDIEGFDYGQIAELLEIPPGTVKSRLHRARAALYEAIEPVLTDRG